MLGEGPGARLEASEKELREKSAGLEAEARSVADLRVELATARAANQAAKQVDSPFHEV